MKVSYTLIRLFSYTEQTFKLLLSRRYMSKLLSKRLKMCVNAINPFSFVNLGLVFTFFISIMTNNPDNINNCTKHSS